MITSRIDSNLADTSKVNLVHKDISSQHGEPVSVYTNSLKDGFYTGYVTPFAAPFEYLTLRCSTQENIERHCNCKCRPEEKIFGRKLEAPPKIEVKSANTNPNPVPNSSPPVSQIRPQPPKPRMSAPKNRQWSEATFREVTEE